MWQTASDFFVFLGWAWQNTTSILGNVFLPVRYIYTFLKEFFDSAFAPPSTPDAIWSFDTGTLAIFGAIPYFNVLISVAVLGIMIFMVVFLLRTFLKT